MQIKKYGPALHGFWVKPVRIMLLSKARLRALGCILLATRSLLNLPSTDAADLESCHLRGAEGVRCRLGVLPPQRSRRSTPGRGGRRPPERSPDALPAEAQSGTTTMGKRRLG